MATLNRLREIHISGEIFGDGEVNNKKSAELDTLLHEMRQKGKITADQQAVLKQVLMDRGYVGVLG
ncbi:MAG: hypothetical protein Q8O99_05160 [bacterium]|nr:hypothetical protein [bacterium]